MTQTEPLGILPRFQILPMSIALRILIPCPFLQGKIASPSTSITENPVWEVHVPDYPAFHALQQWVSPEKHLGTIDVTQHHDKPPQTISFMISYSLQIHVMPPSRGSPGRSVARPPFDKGNLPSLQPADIPLPETRPGTMYGTEVDHLQNHHRQRHSVNAIDFAQRHPLPESRPTTIVERQSNGTEARPLAATVEVCVTIESVNSQPLTNGPPRSGCGGY